MARYEPARAASVGFLLLITLLSVNLSAQTVKIRGMIKARSGATIIVQTSDSPRVIVSLNDETQVSQIEGVLKARERTCQWPR